MALGTFTHLMYLELLKFCENDFVVQQNHNSNDYPFISLIYPLWYTTLVGDHRLPSLSCPNTDPVNTPSWEFCG